MNWIKELWAWIRAVNLTEMKEVFEKISFLVSMILGVWKRTKEIPSPEKKLEDVKRK